MNDVIVVCGFLGAWLLVAGPIWQAGIELTEQQELEREHLQELKSRVQVPTDVSPWWWLLPPVRYLLARRRTREFQHAVMGQLTHVELETLLRFVNKAGAWLAVGSGGFLLAAAETWQLVEHFGWPTALFWPLIVVMSLVSVVNTTGRLTRGREIMAAHQRPDPAADEPSGA